jgi:hypothetical protein
MELSQAIDVVLNLTFEAVQPQSQHKRLEYQIKINPKSLQGMRLNTNKQSEQKGGEQVLAGYGVSRVCREDKGLRPIIGIHLGWGELCVAELQSTTDVPTLRISF